MKKFFKFLGAAAAVCAGVAGGLFIYNKYQEKKDMEAGDFDEDYDDDFSDDEDEETRSYVNINPDSEKADDAEPEKAEASEEKKDAE